MKRLIFYSVLFFMIGGARSSDSSQFYEGPDYSFFDSPSTSSSDVEEGEIVESARVKRARSFESDDDIGGDNSRRRFNHEGAHFSDFDSDIEDNHSDSEDEEDLEVVVDNNGYNIIESNLEMGYLSLQYTEEQLEEIDLVAVSNRNAGVKAGKEEALRELGPHLKIGGIFQKREGDVPWFPGKDIIDIEVSLGESLKVSNALKLFGNLTSDNLFERNIDCFVTLLKLFSGTLSGIDDKKIKKVIADVWAMGDKLFQS